MPDSASSMSKRILAYVACSPVSITAREMELFMLLDPNKAAGEVPRVRASINVLQHCGPLVEIVDDTLQFVHFTVKE